MTDQNKIETLNNYAFFKGKYICINIKKIQVFIKYYVILVESKIEKRDAKIHKEKHKKVRTKDQPPTPRETVPSLN